MMLEEIIESRSPEGGTEGYATLAPEQIRRLVSFN
jgi:hypothetical protein